MIKNRIIYDVNTGVVLDIIVPQILIVGQDNFVEFSLEFMDGLNKVTNINWQVVTIFERPDGEKSNKLLATLTGDAYIKKIPSWATDIEGILKITTQIIVGGVVRPLGIALIPVEEGLEPANDTITEAQYQLLTSELNGLNNKIETHQNRIDNPHQVTKAQLGLENVDPTSDIDKPVSTAQKTYIDAQDNALGVRIDNVETNIDETEADILALETANMIKSITRSGSNLFTITYYDDTTSSLLTLAELKSFIGEATTSLSGLMSAQDKTDLDTLMALFDEDGDSVVNTIQEILDVFQNYPEGVDLVTALAGKVDKVADKSLVSDTEITKLEGLNNQATLDGKFSLKVNTSDIVDNLTSTDTNKPLSAKQGKALQDTKEAIANKAVDFSIVDDTKYPTTKAVDDTFEIKLLDQESEIFDGKSFNEWFDSEQLVTNGDFSDGTTGWTNVTSFATVVNNQLVYTNTGSSYSSIWQDFNVNINDKIYFSVNILVANDNLGFRINYAQNEWEATYYISSGVGQKTGIFTANKGETVRILAGASAFLSNTYDDIYVFNISTLIADKQYSPIYNTTFDLMTDEQIKIQMDEFVRAFRLFRDNSITAIIQELSNKADRLQEAWITPTLLNGWVNTSGQVALLYKKSSLGVVYLRGTISAGTSLTIMTLPIGYRPSGLTRLPVCFGTNFSTMDINSGGGISINGVAPFVGNLLINISFIAEG